MHPRLPPLRDSFPYLFTAPLAAGVTILFLEHYLHLVPAPPYALLLALGVIYANTLVHELGHLLAAVAAGLRCAMFAVGPLTLYRHARGWFWGFDAKQVLSSSGLVKVVPETDEGLRERLLLFNLGGPLASLSLGLVALALFWWLELHQIQVQTATVFNVYLSFVLFLTLLCTFITLLITLLPGRVRGVETDGLQIMRYLKPFADAAGRSQRLELP